MPSLVVDTPQAPFSHVTDSPVSVLVSHGFTGTPASVIHLARAFADAGFNVECPRLSGHGTHWKDMIDLRAEDWLGNLKEAAECLKARSHILFVVGLSMGGTLVLKLAQEDPDIQGVVLINHALLFGNPLVPFARWLKHLVPSTAAIASDIKDPSVKEPAYDRTPTAGVAQLYRLARQVRKGLPAFEKPLLIFKSREDHVLPIRNATYTFEKVASQDKEIVWLENSYHVATMDYDKEYIAEHSLAFIWQRSKNQ